MKKIILSISLLVGTNINSQVGFDRNVINDGVYLLQTGPELQCALDVSKPIKYNSLSTEPLYASVKKDRVNILMEYMNPLKMSYEISYSNQINPDVKNLIEFINGLTPLFQQVGLSKKDIPPLDVSEIFRNVSGTKSLNSPTSKDFKINFYSEELRQLGLLVVYNPDCYFEGYKTNPDIAKTDNAFKTIKANFENNMQILANTEVDFKTYNNFIRKAVNILLDANDITKAKEVSVKFNRAIESVDSLKNIQKNKLQVLTNYFDGNNEIKTLGSGKNVTRIDSLRAGYVKGMREFYLKQYVAKVNKQFETLDKLIEQVKELAVRFNKGLDYFIGCEKCEMGMKLGEIPVSREDIKTVLINIKTYNIELNEDMGLVVTEKENLKGTLILKYHSKVSIDLGTGPLYISGFSFDKYSTELNPTTGSLTIVKTNPERMNFALGTMLNIIWKTDSYPIFPMAQFGFAIGKDAPIVFAGFGLKTVKNISFSFGLLTGWYKELSNLSVGQAVSGEVQLDNDYRYRTVKNPATYFGVQYSF